MKRSDTSTLIVLEAAELAHTERLMMTWEYIQAKTGAPEKVIYSAMEREENRNYLDCGVSMRTSWLTDEGMAKLRGLKGESI